ncbi:MAG: hypothetical protein HY236_12225 [Acidobacteria bacterium]|nr:hypothetical protein [Acidobacteriota bacterium]
MPEWQKELIEQWQREDLEKRTGTVLSLQGQKGQVLDFYQILGYLAIGGLGLGALYFLIQGLRGHPTYYFVALGLGGGAVAAWSYWSPSQYE